MNQHIGTGHHLLASPTPSSNSNLEPSLQRYRRHAATQGRETLRISCHRSQAAEKPRGAGWGLVLPVLCCLKTPRAKHSPVWSAERRVPKQSSRCAAHHSTEHVGSLCSCPSMLPEPDCLGKDQR